MTKLFFICLLLLMIGLPDLLQAQTVQPVGASEEWILLESLSDDFNQTDLNSSKWNKTPGSWAVWSWDGSNVFLADSSLHLRMTYAPHQRNNMDLFYKSGIVRSYERITYGYFEARVKGCHTFPAASPAFWLYSTNNFGHKEIHYSEIDVMEIQQANWSGGVHQGVEHIDMNLHTRVYNEQGEPIWIRPGQDPDLCKNEWDAPWDPREDYHIYAVESRPDSIFWYIDGVERARGENRYWHLPMHITLSLGLRYPHVKYIDGVRYPVPSEATAVGFPTEMEVDYVRVWMKDMVSFHTKPDSIPSGTLMPFSLDYSASNTREIYLQMSDTSGMVLGDTSAVVTQGMGTIKLFLDTDSVLVEEQAVVLTTQMRKVCCPQEEFLDADTLFTYAAAGVDISFQVLDALMGVPIEGVEVEFNGILDTSNLEGMVAFTNIPIGEYRISITAPYHKDIVNQMISISKEGLVILNLLPETYAVRFQVRELKNNHAIHLAKIQTWRGDDLSDLLGEMEMVTPYGDLPYTVSMDNFGPYSDTASISKDTSIMVSLLRVAADLTVKVYHQLNLIQGASVFVGSEQKQTDAAGIAEFMGVPSDFAQTFRIEKEGFEVLNDQLLLGSDTVVIARLSLSTGINEQWQKRVKIYPNPATNRLFVEGIPHGSLLSLTDCTGRQVKAIMANGETVELDLNSLPAGLYSVHSDHHYLSGFVKND